MIGDALLALITGLLELLRAGLPDWSFLNPFEPTSTMIPTIGNPVVTDGGNPLVLLAEFAAQYNRFIPVQEAYGLAVLYIGLQVVLMAFQGARFVINVVRGAGA